MHKAPTLAIGLWMWSLMLVNAQSVPSPYIYQHFDTDAGLPSNFCNAVVQDGLGFLWSLHDNGISRYDGYNFKIYHYDSTDQTGLIGGARSGMMLLDHSKNPWVIHQQLWELNDRLILSRYDRRKDSFVKYYPDTHDPVSHIAFDKNRATIWIGTFSVNGLLNFNIETGRTVNYRNELGKKGSNQFNYLHDQDSVLLLATPEGLWNFHKDTKTFSRPLCPPRDSSLLYHSPIVFILSQEEEPGYLWLIMVGEQHKLVKVDRNFSIVHLETHAPIDGQAAALDKEGSVWFTTATHGLYKYSPGDSSMLKIEEASDNQNGLRTSFLRGLTIDRDQNIWVATTDRGVSKLKKQNPAFHNYKFKGEVTARTVYNKDGDDHLVLSKTENPSGNDNEIFIARIPQDGLGSLKFQHIGTKESINGRINELLIGKNKLWLGTFGAGILSLPIDHGTGMIQPAPLERFEHDPANPNTIGDSQTTALWEDSSGHLWSGTRGQGLNKLDLNISYGKKGSVTKFNHIPGDSTSLSTNMIFSNLYPRDATSLYVVTSSGIELLLNGTFVPYFKNINTKRVVKDSQGKLLIGTKDGLFESNESSGIPTFTKIPSAVLGRYGAFAMQEDQAGRLWITNHHGLVCYDRQGKNSIVFTEADGVNYSRDWIGKTSDGMMITSDPHGITIFNPAIFQMNKNDSKVILTTLTVNNQATLIGSKAVSSEEFSINADISILDELVLDYKHNNFTLGFSAMELTAPEKNLYRHKLEAFDKDWIETDWKSRTATYTNLEAGKYIFRLKASNYHGIWSNSERTLAIIILPPPWQTWWAYTLYSLTLFLIALYWRRYEIRRISLKNQAKHLQELDTLKTRFFTNISHEFRTPLTLILGPLKELYAGKTKEDLRTVLGPVIRNGQRLQKLINQLLDISKLEASKMQLRTSPVEMVGFLRELAASYESLAVEKKIKYLFYPEVGELMVYIDQEKIEKVIHNLLSNAFKFTDAGGEVIMYLKATKKDAVIAVKDTGIGIDSAHTDKIFNRFYQVNSSQTRVHEGSGLGMALAKELVILHGGVIHLESKIGKGSTFTVLLPLGKDHLKPDGVQEASRPAAVRDTHEVLFASNETKGSDFLPASLSGEEPHVLIVEDNTDMRNFVRKCLANFYQTTEAENGKVGLDKALQIIPDLIISDIMMPDMDGYTLCQKIKNNELTSHIPVILLTAKADRESKLEGLQAGADDYLGKPFDADELKLIIRNRLEERRKMRHHFSRAITLEPSHVNITSQDEKFLTRVLALIELHMDDENFSVTDFSREAGYSNIQFYRKIKGLSGQTPSLFMRTIRLKRAADLLSKKTDNISQIAYSVGFSSVSYFNKCFKEQFGMTPGQFTHSVSEADKTVKKKDLP